MPSAQMQSAPWMAIAVSERAPNAIVSTVSWRTGTRPTNPPSLLFVPQRKLPTDLCRPWPQTGRLLHVLELGLVLDFGAHIVINGGQILLAIQQCFEPVIGEEPVQFGLEDCTDLGVLCSRQHRQMS